MMALSIHKKSMAGFKLKKSCNRIEKISIRGIIFLDFMRAIWKGSISFGFVSIPISLFPATCREELKFHLLRSPDLSRVNYKRVNQNLCPR